MEDVPKPTVLPDAVLVESDRKLLKDDNLRSHMARKSRERSLAYYTKDNFINKLLDEF